VSSWIGVVGDLTGENIVSQVNCSECSTKVINITFYALNIHYSCPRRALDRLSSHIYAVIGHSWHDLVKTH
jgi:hypothetical protein